MRGKVIWDVEYYECGGITPAYAGKSLMEWVYTICKQGSPPPMRGKVWLLYHRGEFFRITPAYAGKSGTTRLPSLLH